MSSKFLKCSDWLKILHEQRLEYVGFKNVIHNGVTWGWSTVEKLEPRPPKITYNPISREPLEVGRWNLTPMILGRRSIEYHSKQLLRTPLPSNQVMTSSKILKCSDWLQILHEQRPRYIRLKNIIQSILIIIIRVWQTMTSSKNQKKIENIKMLRLASNFAWTKPMICRFWKHVPQNYTSLWGKYKKYHNVPHFWGINQSINWCGCQKKNSWNVSLCTVAPSQGYYVFWRQIM